MAAAGCGEDDGGASTEETSGEDEREGPATAFGCTPFIAASRIAATMRRATTTTSTTATTATTKKEGFAVITTPKRPGLVWLYLTPANKSPVTHAPSNHTGTAVDVD